MGNMTLIENKIYMQFLISLATKLNAKQALTVSSVNNAYEALTFFADKPRDLPFDLCKSLYLAFSKEYKNTIPKYREQILYLAQSLETIIVEKSKTQEALAEAPNYFDFILRADSSFLSNYANFEITKNLRREFAKLPEKDIYDYIKKNKQNKGAILTNMPSCSYNFFMKVVSDPKQDPQMQALFARALAGNIDGVHKNKLISMVNDKKFHTYGEAAAYMHAAQLTEDEAATLYIKPNSSYVVKAAIIGLPSININKRISLLVHEWSNFKYEPGSIGKLYALTLATNCLVSELNKVPAPYFILSSEKSENHGVWQSNGRGVDVLALPNDLNQTGVMKVYPENTKKGKSFGSSLLETILHELAHCRQKHEIISILNAEPAEIDRISAIYLSSFISTNKNEVFMAFKSHKFVLDYEKLVQKYNNPLFFVLPEFDEGQYFQDRSDFKAIKDHLLLNFGGNPERIMAYFNGAKQFAEAVARHDNPLEVLKLRSFISPFEVYENGWNEFDARVGAANQMLQFARIAKQQGVIANDIEDAALLSKGYDSLRDSRAETLRNLIIKVALNLEKIGKVTDNEADVIKESAYRFVNLREKTQKETRQSLLKNKNAGGSYFE